ncbi:hypothetical protein E2C01_052769 [Portunus trituberculatus]|uniref:Uncharacterized protein n=1 Tax=Portunus trituberculatus TaxID=210409 RepID=A0A5B7GEK8_PORTR|nr:hypothetical protein [Portunus trituberculatus]
MYPSRVEYRLNLPNPATVGHEAFRITENSGVHVVYKGEHPYILKKRVTPKEASRPHGLVPQRVKVSS